MLVVDLDLHDGDGTREIFAADPTVHTFSIHNQTNGGDGARGGSPSSSWGAASTTPPISGCCASVMTPEVRGGGARGWWSHLAGADPAFDDTLGDWNLTPRGMLDRDRFVAELAGAGAANGDGRRPRLPFAVVLAGGYGRNSWRYAARFLAWLHTGRTIEPPSTEEVTLLRYRRSAGRLDPSELTGEGGDDDWGLTEADVLGSLGGAAHRTRLLGFYSRLGVELALERGGLLDRIRALGFARPTLDFDLDNASGETVRMWGSGRRRELLMELRVRRDAMSLPGLEMLRVEWLLLQNPRRRFSPDRQPLPGQRHPGLGFLRDVVAFLVLACERLGLDGILFVPSHYHLAAQSRKVLRFLEPEHEARFRALRLALQGLGPADATRAIEERRVRDAGSGAAVAWEPVPMVLPVSARFKEKVLGEEYEARVAAAGERYRYTLAPPAA